MVSAQVCSAKDLFAINPLDIITKLRFFLYLIVILFGSMHVLAFVAWLRDVSDARYVMRRLRDECGFSEMGEEKAWTWFLAQESDPNSTVFQVRGTAVAFCSLLGLPFSRIRTAMPEEARRPLHLPLCGGADK